MFDELTKNTLVWLPEKEIGYYPVTPRPSTYNGEYFKKYQEYAVTDMGKTITRARVDLVRRYYDGTILDVGIGCGQFILEHGNAFGYDINTKAVAWLEKRGLYRCLYNQYFSAVTFWDSLEHIKNPADALRRVKKLVFITLPVFKDYKSILKSKHFRTDEHYWYFTPAGLIKWFSNQGFILLENNQMETELGREEIQTFVFRRRNNA